jgi:pimeloyl-ACP methyl ester carboxylesterase
MMARGQQDVTLPEFHAGLVRRELPRGVARIIPDGGHWPHKEEPGEFNDLLLRLLRGAVADGPRPSDR